MYEAIYILFFAIRLIYIYIFTILSKDFYNQTSRQPKTLRASYRLGNIIPDHIFEH